MCTFGGLYKKKPLDPFESRGFEVSVILVNR